MKQKWWYQKRYRWALIGSSLSFLGPLGEWVFLVLLVDTDSVILGWNFLFTELWTLLLFTGFGYLLGKSAEKIEQVAFHDALTGVFNRGYLMQHFKELLAFHERYDQPLSVMMFDLDYFKKVNDQYGHLTGDKTLKAVAECVRSTCRESDMVGRYGGEEFLILCPNTSQEEGLNLAERVRQNISKLTARKLGYPGPQTVSIGFMAVPHQETASISSILGTLDQALYRAKLGGRNQVQLASYVASTKEG